MKKNSNKTKYGIILTNRFKKQIKKMNKQGKDIDKINIIIKKLANKEELDIKYRDHQLKDTNKYKRCRELHIEPDWLMIYKYNEEEVIIIMIETGSHSELFNK